MVPPSPPFPPSTLDCGTRGFNVPLPQIFNESTSLQSNKEYELVLQAFAAGNAISSDLSVSAWIDPSIYVDPTFSLAQEFSITLSAGITNAPAAPVPEPSSLSLLAVAVGAAPLLRRRRTKKKAWVRGEGTRVAQRGPSLATRILYFVF
jgi:hypothetical protein